MKKQKGFTLIELVIAVAIVAILASVAIASYSSQVQKSRRTCATSALVTLAAEQERRFFQFNRYEGSINILNNNMDECPEGFYRLTVAVDNAGGNPCDDNSCYTLTATAINAQIADEQCRTFTLDSLGRRTALSDANQATTDACW